ncbi:HAMP domain-containing sensor histidine kinase [Dermabacter hominis]|uniref:HAMP domain-containing sensor histidine kinase n=1 Tax=Dermabacter hominis TaxID=36740 RepID=UPI0021A7DF9C|nr:HAMP domain-containing sensor histidine kinase [Dermabacter hominis]MCT1789450.1 HAMP domain-containing histidine kinase [Dermabacter hominis]
MAQAPKARASRAQRPVSLWTRIVALIALVLVSGTIVTGALSLFLLKRTLIEGVDADLSAAVSPSVIANPRRNISLITMGSPNAQYTPVDYVVEWQDQSGEVLQRVVQDSDGDLSLEFPSLTREEVISLQGKPFTLVAGDRDSWRVRAIASNDPDGPSVFVALPLRSVDKTMNEMALIIVLVGTMVVLVGVGLGGYVLHYALEPLRDVEKAAKNVAAGTLGTRIPVSYSSQEVHSLSVALNEMLIRLEKGFQAQAESQAEALASQSRMRRFVADASHELRTPLAAIRGNGELYRMGAMPNEEDVAQAMRRIEDEAKRMGSLVESLLRLARLDEQRSFDLVPLDASGIVKDVVQDLRALDPTREVAIVDLAGAVLAPEDVPPLGVLGDEAALRQVIVNLVGNANRHTPKGSPVEVALGTDRQGKAIIEVRDHGEGIPADIRERVFERFFRTDESRQRQQTQGGGAGLGLSIAATIMQHHNGTISIHQTDGGGATFRVELPGATLS